MSGSLPAPGISRRDVRPPFATGSAPLPGAEGPLRPTAIRRVTVSPKPWPEESSFGRYPLHHPYVRRFWTAVMGPGAVAALLRLAAAAGRGADVPRPVHMDVLAREGLVLEWDGHVFVRPDLPGLAPHHVRRMPPALRIEHARLDTERHP